MFSFPVYKFIFGIGHIIEFTRREKCACWGLLFFLYINECSIVYFWFLHWLKSFFLRKNKVAAMNYTKAWKKTWFFIHKYNVYIIIIDCNNFIIFWACHNIGNAQLTFRWSFKKNCIIFVSYPIIKSWVKGGTFIFWTFRKFFFIRVQQAHTRMKFKQKKNHFNCVIYQQCN